MTEPNKLTDGEIAAYYKSAAYREHLLVFYAAIEQRAVSNAAVGLSRVRRFLSDRNRWTQKASCRNADGQQAQMVTGFEGDGAVSYCLEGALLHCRAPREAWHLLADAVSGRVLIDKEFNSPFDLYRYLLIKFNDLHTHSQVLDLIDRAIKSIS